MTLKQTIYLSLAAAAIIIGIHRLFVDTDAQSFLVAVGYNYWIFMLAVMFLLLFRYDKKKTKS